MYFGYTEINNTFHVNNVIALLQVANEVHLKRIKSYQSNNIQMFYLIKVINPPSITSKFLTDCEPTEQSLRSWTSAANHNANVMFTYIFRNTKYVHAQTFGKSWVICLMLAPFGPMINLCSQRSTATSFCITLFACVQHI